MSEIFYDESNQFRSDMLEEAGEIVSKEVWRYRANKGNGLEPLDFVDEIMGVFLTVVKLCSGIWLLRQNSPSMFGAAVLIIVVRLVFPLASYKVQGWLSTVHPIGRHRVGYGNHPIDRARDDISAAQLEIQLFGLRQMFLEGWNGAEQLFSDMLDTRGHTRMVADQTELLLGIGLHVRRVTIPAIAHTRS